MSGREGPGTGTGVRGNGGAWVYKWRRGGERRERARWRKGKQEEVLKKGCKGRAMGRKGREGTMGKQESARGERQCVMESCKGH